MTDIEQRALDLLNESRIAFGLAETNVFFRDQTPENEALCRALERQETAMTSEDRDLVEDLLARAHPSNVHVTDRAAARIQTLSAEIERLRGDLEVARKEAGSNYRVALAWERTARAALAGDSHV